MHWSVCVLQLADWSGVVQSAHAGRDAQNKVDGRWIRRKADRTKAEQSSTYDVTSEQIRRAIIYAGGKEIDIDNNIDRLDTHHHRPCQIVN